MKNTKIFVTLLVIAVSLVTAAAVFAGGPTPEQCAKCCASGGPCTGCSCSSGGGGEEQVVYIRPQDKIGEYYEDENGKRIHTSFRTWSECMNHFNDAILCSRIVTDSCESCMGLCKYSGATACNDTCKTPCQNRPVYETEDQKELPGGEDTYGIYHYENGKKIYDGLTDLDACLFMMGDMNRCVTTWGYDCRYGESFYVYEMCIDNYENDCFDRVKSEYADACK